MIITFVSTDSPEPREVFECNFNVSEPTQKFSHAPQNTSSYSLKYNFLHVISAELLLKLNVNAFHKVFEILALQPLKRIKGSTRLGLVPQNW